MQILRILKHFIFIRKTIFFNNRHTYLHSSARSLRPLTVICLPRERRCGKHLQRMLDKCTGGGIKWPRAVYSSLLHKVVAKTFCIFCRVIWIFANLAETLTAWFQSIKVASFVKKKTIVQLLGSYSLEWTTSWYQTFTHFRHLQTPSENSPFQSRSTPSPCFPPSDCQRVWFSITTECARVINACIIIIIVFLGHGIQFQQWMNSALK